MVEVPIYRFFFNRCLLKIVKNLLFRLKYNNPNQSFYNGSS